MDRNESGDAERLLAIHQLDEAIKKKEPDLTAAREARNLAKQNEDRCRQGVKAVDRQVDTLKRETHRTASVAYLNGAALDRGKLTLGNQSLRYLGWRGKIELALEHIVMVEIGNSHLPPRCGIPLVSRLWAGTPRNRGTLLVHRRPLAVAVSNPTLAVLADVEDAVGWQRDIQARQGLLSDVARRHADLSSDRDRSTSALQDASQSLREAQAGLDRVEREIGSLGAQRDKLQAQQREIDSARKRALAQEREALKNKSK